MSPDLTLLIVVLVFLPLVPAMIAKRKGYSPWLFYAFGLVLWIVAVPVSLLIRDRRA